MASHFRSDDCTIRCVEHPCQRFQRPTIRMDQNNLIEEATLVLNITHTAGLKS